MSITTSDLSGGVHWVTRREGPVRGYKYKRFTDCEVERSWFDCLMGNKQTYDVCFSKVTIEPGDEIVRPRAMDHHGVTGPWIIMESLGHQIIYVPTKLQLIFISK